MHILEANTRPMIAFTKHHPSRTDFFSRHTSNGACRKLAARQLIWAEGDLRNEVCFVRSGTVCFYKVLMDGRRVVTGFAYPGDMIGFGIGPHQRNAEAVQCCKLEPMTMANFQSAIASDNDLSDFVQAQSSRELCSSYEHLMVLTKMTASERLAHFLTGLSTRNRRLGYSPNSVLIPMRRVDIADYLGLTIETISRTFTTFKTHGLIGMEDPCVVFILNLERLAALARGACDEEGSVSVCRKIAA